MRKDKHGRPIGPLEQLLRADIERAVTGVLPEIRRHLANKLREAVSVQDQHSLPALRKLDHPYATRHDGQPAHAAKVLGHSATVVHERSGGLLESIFETDVEKTRHGYRCRVGFDLDKADHIPAVLFGTDRMIGRDVLKFIVQQEARTLNKIWRKNGCPGTLSITV